MHAFTVRDCHFKVPEGDWMLREIIDTGDYEPHVMDSFLSLINTETNVLDIGANVGIFTVQAAIKAKHVLAIDAYSENAKTISANVN